MKRIAVLALWFGKLPEYFPLWMRSLEVNKEYDFILLTDDTVEYSTPENLRVIRTTLPEIKNRIVEMLKIKPNFDKAYKMCDFRPAYGELFQDYLNGYEFWGYCDIDLMFGRLADFVTPEILSRYKKVFNRGHFTLYKNEPSVNNLYRLSETIDAIKILESPHCFIFDEWHGIHQIFKESGIDQFHKECIADILPNSARYRCSNIKNYSKQIFIWEKGLLKQYYLDNDQVKSSQVAYLHFQKRKMNITDAGVFKSSSVILSPNGFTPFEGPVTKEIITKYDQGNYAHYIQRGFKSLIKKLPLMNKANVTINRTLISRPLNA